MSSLNDFNTRIIDEFRANAGHVGGPFETTPLLLLHHIGARSETSRITPLAYLEDDGRYAIFASNAGATTNPAWYHNLKAHSDVTIEVGTETIDVSASEASGSERERLFSTQAAVVPRFDDYASQTKRVIPVMILTPR
jgi:deazaflavin-dependent oxidoreductase (nitroreductase family)